LTLKQIGRAKDIERVRVKPKNLQKKRRRKEATTNSNIICK